MGDKVSSKEVFKVIHVGKSTLGTMAGCAADCSMLLGEIEDIVVANVEVLNDCYDNGYGEDVEVMSKYLSARLFDSRITHGSVLSVGTMLSGFSGSS
eukprot:CAMPEP_0118639654 /NCGR_PEP_ID=MMETSP0785-20121206/4336_1 /TAXON_ID=91992 /ORGANISM="Bolidomonas pacifica, Strain CCMP 1866" /LENGTH=96 /DNA_ID=CAMNT_0006530991 /DNA_START=69 /DNA_END=356 /DNA_ORIENTATION=+